MAMMFAIYSSKIVITSFLLDAFGRIRVVKRYITGSVLESRSTMLFMEIKMMNIPRLVLKRSNI